MKAIRERPHAGRRRAPLMLLIFALGFASVSRCKKSPISPDAALLERPIIWLNALEVSFTAFESGPNPDSQELRIRNSGKNTLKYAISDDAPWLSISPAEGTSAGQVNSHAVAVDASGMAARDEDYAATITITCADAYNNPQKVSVALKVIKEPPPEISASPSRLTFAGPAGGANPPAQTLLIRNSGKGVLDYSISDDAGWLDVSPPNGSSSGENRSHTVSVSSGGLAPGSYAAAITVTGPKAANSPQSVSVTLQVTSSGGGNAISVSCSPSQGPTNTIVSFPISISGNSRAIATFGLQLTFDGAMFNYVGTAKGSLTGGWSYVDGNESSGTVTVGGFAGTANPIAAGSSGTVAVITLKVTGGTYGDGQQSVVTIKNYMDDITGMEPEPATTTFTYRK